MRVRTNSRAPSPTVDGCLSKNQDTTCKATIQAHSSTRRFRFSAKPELEQFEITRASRDGGRINRRSIAMKISGAVFVQNYHELHQDHEVLLAHLKLADQFDPLAFASISPLHH